MKTILIAAVFTLVANTAFAEETLEPRTLLDGKVTILVPTSFVLMDAASKKIKYPGANAPSIVLTNGDTDVNLAIGRRGIPLKPEELKNLEAPMRAQFGEENVHASGIRFINGHAFLLFNADSEAPDGTIRNVIAMTSHEGTMLVISYNCLVSKNAGCDQLGSKLIGSIKLTP